MFHSRISNRLALFCSVGVLVVASGCASTVTITQADLAASPSSTEMAVELNDPNSSEGDAPPTTAPAPTSLGEPTPDPTAEPESAPDSEPSVEPTAAPSSETSAFQDELNRPLDERIAALATIDDGILDPKRVTDRISLDTTWWGLGSDVYPGNPAPAGPIPEIGDPIFFCDEGYLDGSPGGTSRASRNWSADSVEYRAVTVGASAMLSGGDAANAIERDQLVLENCGETVSADGQFTRQVVDSQTGRFLVIGGTDNDLVLVYTRFTVGSLVVTVSAAGDASILEQLIADTEYGLQAAVFATEVEVKRVGAVAQLRPDLQEDLAEFDAYCRGHDQWETSIGLTRTPLKYFEDLVGYFDGVEAPQEIVQQFDTFQSANAEMVEVVQLETILTQDELGEHPAWVELRERYGYTDAMTAVWDFGRENC